MSGESNNAVSSANGVLQRRERRHPPRLYRHRKMSFPAAVASSSLSSGLTGHGVFMGGGNTGVLGGSADARGGLAMVGLDVPESSMARGRIRRFSNVSETVSRKLSTTIGWPRPVSVQEVVAEAKSLCGQYIRCRLKRAGLFNRKLGLQRLKSAANLPGGIIICEVFGQLQSIGLELERMHPKLYSGICRQVAVTITSEKSVRNVLSSVAGELFKSDISWGKVVSLYCVAGGLGVDCVRQGHPEYLFGLVETMGLVVERDVATWMAQQGGWTALLSRYRQPDEENGVFQMMALSVVCLIFLLVGAVFVLRTIGKIAFGMSRVHFRPYGSTSDHEHSEIL